MARCICVQTQTKYLSRKSTPVASVKAAPATNAAMMTSSHSGTSCFSAVVTTRYATSLVCHGLRERAAQTARSVARTAKRGRRQRQLLYTCTSPPPVHLRRRRRMPPKRALLHTLQGFRRRLRAKGFRSPSLCSTAAAASGRCTPDAERVTSQGDCQGQGANSSGCLAQPA